MAEDKFAYKDKENTFTETNTFNEGVTIGQTPLTSASLKNIVEQTDKVPDIENDLNTLTNDLDTLTTNIPTTYRKIDDSYSKIEIDEKLKNIEEGEETVSYTPGEGIKIEDNVISQNLFIITDVEIGGGE